MTTPAIRISNLSKSYRIQHDDTPRATNLGEAITKKIRAPFKRSQKETFWALKDIDLEINKGEVVGVIGRNGAGKSTLLKVLSRITEPTSGRIELFGRVGSLLEVGTGFHPELTGRENIFLNGAILGMRREEIKKQFDAIVDFAGVEKFLDTPVKRYSSGMYVRLAFAVAAHLNPEILIVDEVLAVGDAEFQKKCLGKMQDVAQSGRTVLFVSHNMAAVQRLCSTGVLLSGGRVLSVGSVTDVIDVYLRQAEKPCIARNAVSCDGLGQVVASVEPLNATTDISAGDKVVFRVGVVGSETIRITRVGLGINNSSGLRVCTLLSDYSENHTPTTGKAHSYICSLDSPFLAPGRYSVKLSIGDAGLNLMQSENFVTFEVAEADALGCGRLLSAEQGVVVPATVWERVGDGVDDQEALV